MRGGRRRHAALRRTGSLLARRACVSLDAAHCLPLPHVCPHPAAPLLPHLHPQVYYLAARQVKAQLRLGLSHLHAPAGAINVDAWGTLALQVAQHVRAGSRVQVHGSLRQDSWVDRGTGERQWMVKVGRARLALHGCGPCLRLLLLPLRGATVPLHTGLPAAFTSVRPSPAADCCRGAGPAGTRGGRAPRGGGCRG